jgi:hypothetical protein
MICDSIFYYENAGFYIEILQAYVLEALGSGRDCELHVHAWRIQWVMMDNLILSWMHETNEFLTSHVEYNTYIFPSIWF